jgi:hypothetical protein
VRSEDSADTIGHQIKDGDYPCEVCGCASYSIVKGNILCKRHTLIKRAQTTERIKENHNGEQIHESEK